MLVNETSVIRSNDSESDKAMIRYLQNEAILIKTSFLCNYVFSSIKILNIDI